MSIATIHKIGTYSLVTLVGMMTAAFAAYYVVTEFVYIDEVTEVVSFKEVSTADQSQVASTSQKIIPVTGEDALERGLLFVGELQKIDDGCLSGEECSFVVEQRKIIAPVVIEDAEVGEVKGVSELVELEASVGELVEIYAQELDDKTYTLYGSNQFYAKLLP